MRIEGIKRSGSNVGPHNSFFSSIKKPCPQDQTNKKISPEIDGGSNRNRPSVQLPINEDLEWTWSDKINSHRSLDAQKDLKNIFEGNDEDKETGFEDGRISGLEYNKCLVIEGVIGLIAIIGTFLAILANELEFEGNDPALLDFLLWAGSVVTLFLISLTVLRHLQLLEFEKKRKIIPKKTNLFDSGRLGNIGFEILILLLQPYPFFTGIRFDLYSDVLDVEYFYYLNDILALLIVVRLSVLIRLYLNISVYRSPRARRVAVMYGAENNYLYACKCKIKEDPVLNVLFFFFSSVFVFGYMIRICERPLNRNAGVQQDFRNYSNGMWLIIVTMTTVGYGDFYPRTHLGRAVVLLVCIWGVFVVSLIVVSLNNILTLSTVEEKSLTVLKRLNLRKKLKNDAAKILTNVAKIRIKSKSADRYNLKYTGKYHLLELKKYLSNFRESLRQLKYTNDNANVTEEMHRRFDIMGDNIYDLTLNQNNLEQILQNINQHFLNNENFQVDSINSLSQSVNRNETTSIKTLD